MNTLKLLLGALTTLAFVSTLASHDALAGEPIVYPKKGQSEAQQSKDKASCQAWAKKQLGYDPEMLLEQSQQAGATAPKSGAGRGAAKGAAAGALGGAIGGDAGKGAEIGAGVGAVGGAGRRAHERKAENQGNEQVQQKLNEFNKAEGTCLSGKGYSVG